MMRVRLKKCDFFPLRSWGSSWFYISYAKSKADSSRVAAVRNAVGVGAGPAGGRGADAAARPQHHARRRHELRGEGQRLPRSPPGRTRSASSSTATTSSASGSARTATFTEAQPDAGRRADRRLQGRRRSPVPWRDAGEYYRIESKECVLRVYKTAAALRPVRQGQRRPSSGRRPGR